MVEMPRGSAGLIADGVMWAVMGRGLGSSSHAIMQIHVKCSGSISILPNYPLTASRDREQQEGSGNSLVCMCPQPHCQVGFFFGAAGSFEETHLISGVRQHRTLPAAGPLRFGV